MRFLILIFLFFAFSVQAEQWKSGVGYQSGQWKSGYGYTENYSPQDPYGSVGKPLLSEPDYYYDKPDRYDPVLKQPQWRKEGCSRYSSTLCDLNN